MTPEEERLQRHRAIAKAFVSAARKIRVVLAADGRITVVYDD